MSDKSFHPLSITLRATTFLLLFSRARYTLPNLPLPKARPISKSESLNTCVYVSEMNVRSD